MRGAFNSANVYICAFFMIEFIYNVKPKNIFKIKMKALYPSFVGTVNIVFTLSMLVLFISLYSKMNIAFKIIVFVAFIYFPLIHTSLMYLQAIKQAEDVPKNIKLTFDDKKWMVNDTIYQYSKIKISIIKFGFCLIYLDNREAYIVDASMTDIMRLNAYINDKIKV